MKKTIFVVITIAALACALVALSQGPPPAGGPMGPGGPGRPGPMPCPVGAVMPPHADMIDGIANGLQLTADQKTALGAILTNSDAVILPLGKTVADKTLALRKAVMVPASQYDQTTVYSLAAEATNAETALVAACINAWNDIRSNSTLTDDQLAKLMAGPGPCGPPPPPPPPPTGGSSSGSSTSGGTSSVRHH